MGCVTLRFPKESASAAALNSQAGKATARAGGGSIFRPLSLPYSAAFAELHAYSVAKAAAVIFTASARP
jgi:hypothetical protein